ncbi:uncharacterized protein EDB91DRAFT_577017 [Suillus paluster]|uniref:uncharacterized protein n=1 Tax=Suillus paluster TaxID=48578 RepID=UPI001B875E6E|nr:uncharacterized protein EDB91DRAFT_577017 [Suillus paluster]KAG1734930.1 hypothetical protein EDB91DRAFT_577017 [Suillus paluster]
MTLISNRPIWWPSINASNVNGYFVVASCAGLVYDFVLSFGQEVELIWKQRWSLMTILYLTVRYAGIPLAIASILFSVTTIPLTDKVSLISYLVVDWTRVLVNQILGIILIARLNAMYQRSRKVLVFLVSILLSVCIANITIAAFSVRHGSGEELILSGTYRCTAEFEESSLGLDTITWYISIGWESIAMCFAIWIAVKRFRELRQLSTRGILGDCFTVLIQTHVAYFASFLAASCFEIGYLLSPLSANTMSLESQIYAGLLQIFTVVQLFVLGPRLILSVRQFNAKLVAGPDIATAMTSVDFQERVHVSTSSSV